MLALRRPPTYYTYFQLAEYLNAKDVNVSERQVADSIRKYAPLALRLPERAGDYLRREHEKYLDSFDSWETMKLLIIETEASIGALNQQLEDESLSKEDRDSLVGQRTQEIERAWRFTAELERLKRELDPDYVPAQVRGPIIPGVTPGTGAELVGAGASAFLAGMEELEKRVLSSINNDSRLVTMLGAGNVSVVGEGEEEEELDE